MGLTVKFIGLSHDRLHLEVESGVVSVDLGVAFNLQVVLFGSGWCRQLREERGTLLGLRCGVTGFDRAEAVEVLFVDDLLLAVLKVL